MKKIMFNDKYGLTKAVLECRKTQTRRVINLNPSVEIDGCKHLPDGSAVCGQLSNGKWIFSNRLCSTYKVGEEIAVAQSYDECFKSPNYKIENDGSLFVQPISEAGYTNKMFVRADLMQHRIKITNIRVERLQDISENDCINEGIVCKNGRYVVETYKGVVFYTKDVKLAFKYLIDKTCGRGTWESNSYVFVYDFELVK